MSDSIFDSCRQCGSPRHSMAVHDRLVEGLSQPGNMQLPTPDDVQQVNVIRLEVTHGEKTARASTIASLAVRYPEGEPAKTYLTFEVQGDFADLLSPSGSRRAVLRLE